MSKLKKRKSQYQTARAMRVFFTIICIFIAMPFWVKDWENIAEITLGFTIMAGIMTFHYLQADSLMDDFFERGKPIVRHLGPLTIILSALSTFVAIALMLQGLKSSNVNADAKMIGPVIIISITFISHGYCAWYESLSGNSRTKAPRKSITNTTPMDQQIASRQMDLYNPESKNEYEL